MLVSDIGCWLCPGPSRGYVGLVSLDQENSALASPTATSLRGPLLLGPPVVPFLTPFLVGRVPLRRKNVPGVCGRHRACSAMLSAGEVGGMGWQKKMDLSRSFDPFLETSAAPSEQDNAFLPTKQLLQHGSACYLLTVLGYQRKFSKKTSVIYEKLNHKIRTHSEVKSVSTENREGYLCSACGFATVSECCPLGGLFCMAGAALWQSEVQISWQAQRFVPVQGQV